MFNRKLIKNKIYSILLITIGAFPIMIDGDATFLVFALFLAIPLLFAKKNWIE